MGAGLLIKAESSVPSLRFWTWEKESGKGRKGKIEGRKVRGRWREKMRDGGNRGGVERDACVSGETGCFVRRE